MKKNKILTALITVPTIGCVAMPLCLCSCKNVTLDTIAITTMPSTEFNLNDKFDYTGIVVSANYSDKTSKDVTTHCTFSQPNMSTVGEKRVIVTHIDSNKTTSYKINVKDPTIPPEHKFTITFNVNDGSGKTFSQEIKPGKKVTKPATPISINNLDFVAWYTEDGSSTTWDESKRFNFDNVLFQDQQLYARWSGGFNNKGWLEVSNAISAFEEVETPTEVNAKTLIEALGVTYEATKVGNTVQETLQNHLVGLTGNVVMNGQVHTVKCIDAMHDTITGSSTKAALTFELFTLLSDSNGKYMGSRWSDTNNTDYLNSVLRANLNKTGTGTIAWRQKNDSEEIILSEKRSAFEMIQEGSTNLANAIKSVTKQVATKPSGSYELTTYDDKLFALTNTEMGYSEEKPFLVEGTIYKYWRDNEAKETEQEKKDGRKKQDIIKTEGLPGTQTGSFQYWLTTPNTGSNGSAFVISAFAIFSLTLTKIMNGTSFAFCI